MSTHFEITKGLIIRNESTLYRVLEISNLDDKCAVLAHCQVEETGQTLDLKCIHRKYLHNYKQEAKVLHYLKEKCPEDNNFVKIIEMFGWQEWYVFVLEKLDMRLSDFLKSRTNERLNIKEIRVITRQMLSALSDLRNVGITHMNINAENMLVNHEFQPFKIKLTGFGGAGKTSRLSGMSIPKLTGYSAPEVFLQSSLDESLDMWSLGSTLAFLFLGFPLYPSCCDYEYMRMIVNINGLPNKTQLDQGQCTEQFFTMNSDWRLQTPEEYEQKTGRKICHCSSFYNELKSIHDLVFEMDHEDFDEFEDIVAFIDLLEKMLTVNPNDRISPSDALNHRFITKDCPKTSNNETSECEPTTPSDVIDEESDELINDAEGTFILDEGVTFGLETTGMYYLEEFIGVGWFGAVAKCRKVGTEELVAVKIFNDQNREFGEEELEALEALSSLDPDESNIIRFIDSFIYKGYFFIVQELLDVDLINFLQMQELYPLTVAEIRPIAQQMLVALRALRSIGISHLDIKGDNIMLVHHDSQPFNVKLIDFGLAKKTADLSETEKAQINVYRAPEVYLGLPYDEGVDMWSLGCTLVSIFQCQDLFTTCEYETVRRMIKLFGLPDKSLLDKGMRVTDFFTKIHSGSETSWRFKTKEEYTQTTGESVDSTDPSDGIESLDELLERVSEEDNPIEFQDVKSFIDLIKKMLEVNPAERILPDDALNHPFITMEHLPGASSYVTEAQKIVAGSQITNTDSDTEADRDESELGLTESEDKTETLVLKLDKDKILPDDVLDHPFTTTDHLPSTSLGCHVTKADEIPAENQPSNSNNDTETDKDESELDLAESKDETETSMLRLDKDKILPDNVLNHPQSESSLTESEDETETSTLYLLKGVKIISKSIVYIIEEVIGSGWFGKVVKCRKEGTDEMVAIKVIRKEKHLEAMEEINVYNYLRKLDFSKHNIIKLNHSFIYKDCYCLVFELLHSTLFDLLKKQNFRGLTVDEIRPIAQQMLVTLSGLKSIGVIHSDIKADNIMLVNHDLQPFEVKLIDFGLAFRTSNLFLFNKVQPAGYRAPEVYLGLPYNESIDMWGLACTLAYMYLVKHLFPEHDYEAMSFIVKCCGMPDKNALDNGTHVKHFFTLDQSGPEHYWRLKTKREYERETGLSRFPLNSFYENFESLDDLVKMASDEESYAGLEDLKAFIDLLKKMLAVNPADRITPDDALNHPFITKGHLPSTSLRSHVTEADEIPAGNQPSNSDRDTDVDNDGSDLDLTEDEKESSTLQLEKGVKIVDESDVYLVEEVLGYESCGQFVKCRKEGTDKIVEIKVFRKQNHMTAIREVNLYSSLSNKDSNMRKYIQCFIYKDCFCLVFEHARS